MDRIMTDEHFHIESLEEFISDLAAAGFEPVATSGAPRWRGPAHPAFGALTEATTMDVVIRPGWPFQPSVLLVDGLDTNHLTLDGFVCMWRDGDPSLEWTTVAGFFSRIERWCENAKRGWEDDPLGYDAFLNFSKQLPNIATFNLSELNLGVGQWGECHGVVSGGPLRVDITPGRQHSANQLRCLWFQVGELETPPPRQFSEVFRSLSRNQRKGLERALEDRRRPEPFVASGGVDLVLFCWERLDRTDLLVMACEGTAENMEAIALQPAPTDEKSLILRAGSDAPMLRTVRVTMFGAGALGGHVGSTLAESGLGHLDIVDSDVLLPGNVVRHVAGHDQVGKPKVQAVRQMVANHAPWTEVDEFLESPMTPGRIGQLIASADIIVNTTGNDAFTGALAMVAERLGTPLVSGALYRGGNIARVQRQVLDGDTPIHLREEGARYPIIPVGDGQEDFATPELGCSAPVNNAPPASVMACASLIVQVTLDALTGRYEFNDEVIYVYRSIPEAPFNKIGRLT